MIPAVAVVAVVALALGIEMYQSYANGRNKTMATPQTQKSETTGSHKIPEQTKSGKTLVVYFSRKGANFDGNLKVGHTKVVADFIQKHTKADEYEIVPVQDYSGTYDETTDQAKKEQQENARPKIKNPLPDVSSYDTVFIGGPIWWGEYPMIVRTFMDAVDLNGKTVIPFTTAAGSGLGNTQEAVRKQYPQAKVLDGFTVEGTKADGAEGQINDWLAKIGY
ncbi:flavodoxin [Bombiscardovia apis]|uniref:Flavodoxin n=2 Tax=Bombiscardovia apis TaxID=2932182 RepID=A0ABM8BDX0_9BIFI|nr:flavodoxin [Bombiscardovia apis]